MSSADLQPHALKLALVHPQIAPNVGNIARTCVATGTALHLVKPMGFVLDDKRLKRAALDYWPRVDLTLHDDLPAFRRQLNGRAWWFDSAGTTTLWDADFGEGDWLVLGSETRGFPPEVVEEERLVRLPQVPGERCLNLSSAAAVVLFEALRRIQSPHG